MRTVREMSPKWKDKAKATGKLYGHPVVNGEDVKPGDVILIYKDSAYTVLSLGSVIRGRKQTQAIDHHTGKQTTLMLDVGEVYAKPMDLNSEGSAQDRMARAMAWNEKVVDSGLKFVAWAGLGLPTDKEMAKVFAKAKKDSDELKGAYGVESRRSLRSELLALAEDDELGEVSDVQKILRGLGKAPGGFAGKHAGELAVGDVLLFVPGGTSRWGAIVTDLKPVGKTQVKISMLTNLGKPYEIKKDREFMMAVPTEFNTGTPEHRMKLAMDWAKRLKGAPELEKFLYHFTWVPQSDAEADAAIEKAQLDKDEKDGRDAQYAAKPKPTTNKVAFDPFPVIKATGGAQGSSAPSTVSSAASKMAQQKAVEARKAVDSLDYDVHASLMALKAAQSSFQNLTRVLSGALDGTKAWGIIQRLPGILIQMQEVEAALPDVEKAVKGLAPAEDKGFGGTQTMEAFRGLAGLTSDDLSSYAEARNGSRFRR